MKKKILLVAGLLLLGIAAFIYIRTRPSGDINKYKELFVEDTTPKSDSSVMVTFFGVSTLLFDDGKTQILIDGFFSRPGMIKTLFNDISSDTAVIDEIVARFGMNRVKGVFVTHSHYDHAFDAGYVTKRTGAILYGSASTLNIGRGAGLTEDKLKLFEPNKDLTIGDFTTRVVPSKHSPGNALKDDEIVIGNPLSQPASFKAYAEGGSFDFLISHHGKTIFVKPSPNYIKGALDSLDVDALFLGIATVTKQDSTWVNEFYQENVSAINPSLVVPIHWDDFFYPVSDELVMLPKFAATVENDFDYFVNRTRKDKIDFRILQGTKTISLF